jgi:transcription initiation factor IIF auxiliary subunit
MRLNIFFKGSQALLSLEIGRQSLIMIGTEKKKESEGAVYKAYVIKDGKKVYIDPEFLKKLVFDLHESYIFRGKRIYLEKN